MNEFEGCPGSKMVDSRVKDEAEIAEYVESRLEGAIDEDVKESDLEETIESRENYNDKGEYLEDNAGDGMEADAAEGE